MNMSCLVKRDSMLCSAGLCGCAWSVRPSVHISNQIWSQILGSIQSTAASAAAAAEIRNGVRTESENSVVLDGGSGGFCHGYLCSATGLQECPSIALSTGNWPLPVFGGTDLSSGEVTGS